MHLIRFSLIEPFYKWLKESNKPYEERGLTKDAPQEAREGYQKYIKMIKETHSNNEEV